MEKEEIFSKVRDVIVEKLKVKPEQVTLDAHFIQDLGADSLDTVELIMSLEDHFKMTIPDEEAEKLDTVGKAVDYIYNKLKG
jgi:acyl carrier protein